MNKKLLKAALLAASCMLIYAAASLDAHASEDKKPYTIMVYMNGSDLESESGLATDDIIQMQDAGLQASAANLIVFTGGTVRWFNDVVPSYECVMWQIEDGMLYELERLGTKNMGNSSTLSDFIKYSIENFPAEKYGLILWDHGGGSIAGFGHDEVYDADNLSLLDMAEAFRSAGLAQNKLEFLGFDSCLMGSVEMAVIASPYANVMIASEDLEPGEGWDYAFLSELNENPGMSGKELGVRAADMFMDFYEGIEDENLSLSVIDLSKAGGVMDAIGELMEACRSGLRQDAAPAFRSFARRRGVTKTFGEGSPRDNESDMVDAGDMAVKLFDLYPEQAQNVLTALNGAVLYNRHNSEVNLHGLSSFYIYAGRDTAEVSLRTYDALNMSRGYTGYLQDFATMLISNANRRTTRGVKTQPNEFLSADPVLWQMLENGTDIIASVLPSKIRNDSGIDSDTLWPAIDGRLVCLYETGRTACAVQYAIPANLNGSDCDIIIALCADAPEGKILGARNEYGYIIQKGFDVINKGDTLAFYYPAPLLGEDMFAAGESFTTGETLTIEWLSAPDGTRPGYFITDVYNNKKYVEAYEVHSDYAVLDIAR